MNSVSSTVQPPSHETPDNAAALLEVVRSTLADLRQGVGETPHVTLDSVLDRDLGLDSLARVELLTRIERDFDVQLPSTALQTAETCGDLLAALSVARPLQSVRPAVVARPLQARALEADLERVPPPHIATLNDVLAWHAQHHGAKVQMTLCDQSPATTVSYEQLWREAHAVAGGLQHQGLQSGDRVALMLPTGVEYFFAFLGILFAGGIPVPIYPPTRLTQLEEHIRRHARILENAGVTTLVTGSEIHALARLLRMHVPSLRRITTVAELNSEHATATPVDVRSEAVAFLQYTSGSTGQPKGVMLTHANLLANLRALGAVMQVNGSDVFVSWLPLYHDMGLIGAWLGTLYFGVPLVLMSPLTFLARPARWLLAIHEYGGTLSAAPNFAYELCLKRIVDEEITGLDLGSWRIATNGAEAVAPATIARFQERFGRYGFRATAMTPVYGLAESAVGLTFPPLNRAPLIDSVEREPLMQSGIAKPAGPDIPNPLRFVSCGVPLPGHQVRIVDETGRELAERAEGRLEFKGPSATSGYFRNPAATARLKQGDWLDSGDRAYVAGGELYVTGRVKDIIIRAGRHIYPEELEAAVGEIEGVRKGCVAVFGSTDAASGTEHLIVMAETYARDTTALNQLRERVTQCVVAVLGEPPDEVVLAPPHTVLKTSSGKLRRAASRELYESGRHTLRPHAAWWQMTRLAMSTLRPSLLRARRQFAEVLYAGYFWGLFIVLGAITWSITAVSPRPALAWSVNRFTARLFIRLTGIPFVVRGTEHLPRAAPYIVVSNHASYLDGMFIIAALPQQCCFVAKTELQRNPIARWYLRRIGAEFIERFDTQASVAGADHLVAGARSGRSYMIFPEGTFTRAPGLMPFHLGAFAVAVKTGLPIMPIAIRGMRSLLRDEQWWPRRGPVVMDIGVAIVAPEKSDAFSTAVNLRDAAREFIRQRCGEPDLQR